MSLLVQTTYKNNFTLMSLFYDFYVKTWNPTTFLFLVGNTSNKQDNIDAINNILNVKLEFFMNVNLAEYPTVKNVIMYRHENIYVLMYDTQDKYPNNSYWDSTRAFLSENLHTRFPKAGFTNFIHDYYINVDNDDFLYTSDRQNTLSKNINSFHTLEYVPTDTFDLNAKMTFISCPYYFKLKSEGKTLSDNIHTFCRRLDYKNPLYHCVHEFEGVDNYIKCEHDMCTKFDIRNITHCCFAFTCPSLQSLICEKHWDHTSGLLSDGHMSMENVPDDVQKRFYMFYSYDSLTESEKEDIPRIDIDFHKMYIE